MFIYRLQQEFRENRIISIAWLLTLAMVYVGFRMWWNEQPGDSRSDWGQVWQGLAIMVAMLVIFIWSYGIFKRDDLKDPTAFWATRPVRSMTLYGAKLVYLLLVLVLPLVVGIYALACGYTEDGLSLWNGIELLLWGVVVTGFLGLSAMARRGAVMGYWIGGLFIAGVVAACVLVNSIDAAGYMEWLDDTQMKNNALWVLILLAGLLVFGLYWQMSDKHRIIHRWIPLFSGMLVVGLISFVKLPALVNGGDEASELEQIMTSFEVIGPQQASEVMYDENPGYRFHYALNANHLVKALGEYEVVGSKLDLDGQDATVQAQIGIGQTVQYLSSSPESLTTCLNLTVTVMRDPFRQGHGSSSSRSLETKFFDGVPTKRVWVRGDVEVVTKRYQELYRGKWGEKFEVNQNGALWRFQPGLKKRHDNSHGLLVGRQFHLDLLSSPAKAYYEKGRLKLTDGKIELVAQRNSSYGDSGLFGRGETSEIVFSELDRGIADGKVVINDREINLSTWLEKAQVVLEDTKWGKRLRIPVEIEITLPDPAEIKKRLLE